MRGRSVRALVLAATAATGIYVDEVGQYDWYLHTLGAVEHADFTNFGVSVHASAHASASTQHDGVVSCFAYMTGTLSFRKVLSGRKIWGSANYADSKTTASILVLSSHIGLTGAAEDLLLQKFGCEHGALGWEQNLLGEGSVQQRGEFSVVGAAKEGDDAKSMTPPLVELSPVSGTTEEDTSVVVKFVDATTGKAVFQQRRCKTGELMGKEVVSVVPPTSVKLLWRKAVDVTTGSIVFPPSKSSFSAGPVSNLAELDYGHVLGVRGQTVVALLNNGKESTVSEKDSDFTWIPHTDCFLLRTSEQVACLSKTGTPLQADLGAAKGPHVLPMTATADFAGKRSEPQILVLDPKSGHLLLFKLIVTGEGLGLQGYGIRNAAKVCRDQQRTELGPPSLAGMQGETLILYSKQANQFSAWSLRTNALLWVREEGLGSLDQAVFHTLPTTADRGITEETFSAALEKSPFKRLRSSSSSTKTTLTGYLQNPELLLDAVTEIGRSLTEENSLVAYVLWIEKTLDTLMTGLLGIQKPVSEAEKNRAPKLPYDPAAVAMLADAAVPGGSEELRW